MTLIWVVNPNTTEAMTAAITRSALAVVAPGTTVAGITPESGPPSIESHYDEAMSVPGVLTAIRRGEEQGVDGYVIACFGDPGLDAAREVARGPVIGIAEAAMHTASHLGRGFSVVTTLGRTIGRAAELAERYGMQRFCRGIHACELPVLDLDTDPDAVKIVTEACRQAVDADGSDVVVLGCAGMADMCAVISADVGVPVVDGVSAATLTVQSLVAMGLKTSTRGEYAPPPEKVYAVGG
ncbi:aspartate/glutamate racemase family protein [Mycolicibacterium chlorophenolicum]|uniref:Hydantoin racemase n=1 Tax=Mycolicibacterium chlorophenolicum TaxID=37916 RepID=A0A0J6YGC8_9MYCO|nr:aspartate/glutamate racemase family protein [Mycolicibacterium chlorophenolicum]KMO71936.1 Asp/Glu/Hydantoin racemase [Mycolicibacterium chlorophenolicum]